MGLWTSQKIVVHVDLNEIDYWCFEGIDDDDDDDDDCGDGDDYDDGNDF